MVGDRGERSPWNNHDNNFLYLKASQKFSKLMKLRRGWTHNMKREDHLLRTLCLINLAVSRGEVKDRAGGISTDQGF